MGWKCDFADVLNVKNVNEKLNVKIYYTWHIYKETRSQFLLSYFGKLNFLRLSPCTCCSMTCIAKSDSFGCFCFPLKIWCVLGVDCDNTWCLMAMKCLNIVNANISNTKLPNLA